MRMIPDGLTLQEKAKLVFQKGFCPSLPINGLLKLKRALIDRDEQLVQGATSVPPPLMCVQDWNMEAGCAIGYCTWKGTEQPDDPTTVGEVEEMFARCCFEADQRLGEPARCRHFLNWFDDTPFDELRPELTLWIDEYLESIGATCVAEGGGI